MYMCGYLHMSAVSLDPEEGIGSPECGLTGYCDPFHVDAGNEIGSSVRAVLAFNL